MSKPQSPLPILIPNAKPGDQPATRRMLSLVRSELKSDIKALGQKMGAQIGALRTDMGAQMGVLRADMDSQTSGLRAEIGGLRTETAKHMGGLRAEIGGLKAEVSEIRSEIHASRLLFEEQNANNRIVLEGLQALWQRQDRIEKDVHAQR